MSLQAAVTDRPLSPEHFQRADWVRMLNLGPVERVARLFAARNPLSGTPLEAVWGFCSETGKLRFFDAPRAREAAGNDLQTCRSLMGRFASWLPAISTLQSQKPTIADVCTALERGLSGESRVQGQEDKFLASARDDFRIAWRKFSKVIVVAVYDHNIYRRSASLENSAIDAAIVQFFDYYAHRERYWSSIPLDYIVKQFENPTSAYLWMFCDPPLFDPLRTPTQDMFIWPWQQCLTRDANDNVVYRQIRTTSLVMDLRNSTTAMNLFRSPEIYADFISEVVEAGRRIVVEKGGFFDKETGDGIVAHFCDVHVGAITQRNSSHTERAYIAGMELGRAIAEICGKYQEHLELGIGGLGPSIGLHVGGAVWMVVDQQVRAMGPSVVMAARLCACAGPTEGILSNHAFVELGKAMNASQLSRMFRKPVSIKEHDSRAELYAHAFKI